MKKALSHRAVVTARVKGCLCPSGSNSSGGSELVVLGLGVCLRIGGIIGSVELGSDRLVRIDVDMRRERGSALAEAEALLWIRLRKGVGG